MNKKLFVLLFGIFILQCSLAQYEDDTASNRNADSISNNSGPRKLKLGDDIMFGMGIYPILQSNVFFIELGPYAAYKVADPVMVGAGLKTMYLTSTGYNAFYYGPYMFSAVRIANQYFVHAEFSMLNGRYGKTATNPGTRKWVASPIIGGGYALGSYSYAMIGYAFNKDYAEINPIGNIVVRYNITF